MTTLKKILYAIFDRRKRSAPPPGCERRAQRLTGQQANKMLNDSVNRLTEVVERRCRAK